MYKILFVFPGLFSFGGTENVMINIFDNIDRTEFQIDFLLFDLGKDQIGMMDKLKEEGSKIYQIIGRGDNWIEHKKQLSDFFKKYNYDIVHTHMNALGAEVLREAKKNHIDVRIAHSHNTWHQLKVNSLKSALHFIYLEFEKLSLRKFATHYISCSEFAGEWLFGRKICKTDNYLIFRNAINVENYEFNLEKRKFLRKQFRFDDDKYVIGHIGRFDEQKNHEFLLEVFKEFYMLHNNARLCLVGIGENQEKCKEYVKNNQLTGKVFFLNNRSDVADLLQVFDLFLFPSKFEGLPLALVEAQAAGLKCLASDAISPSVDICGNLEFLDISSGIENWIEYMNIAYVNRDERISQVQKIRENGYDMLENIKVLEKFYKKALNKRI